MSTSKENENWTNQVYNPFGSQAAAEAGEMASLSNRFLAGLIDGVSIGIVSSVISVPILMTGMVPWFLASLFCAGVAFGIFAAANYGLLSREGQTIGKKIMNLKIVNQDGSQPDVKELLAKRYAAFWLVSAIPFIGGLVSIANVCLVFRKSRLAGHDEIAKTKVVNA